MGLMEEQVVEAAPGIGVMIDEMYTLRERKRALERQAAEVQKEYDVIEARCMERMQQEGTPKVGGRFATVTYSERVLPTIKDWDKFCKFMARKKWFHLVEKRASVSGCREIWDMNLKGGIPGIEPFKTPTLRLVVNGEK